MPFDITFHTSQAQVKAAKPFDLEAYKAKRRARILAGLSPEPPRVKPKEKDDE